MTKAVVTFDSGTVDGSCGLGWVGYFEQGNHQLDSWYSPAVLGKKKSDIYGGTDFFVSGFINHEDCRKAYDILTKKYKLVFQSPVRQNKNSKNDFFFCIFDKSKKKDIDKLEDVSFPKGMNLIE